MKLLKYLTNSEGEKDHAKNYKREPEWVGISARDDVILRIERLTVLIMANRYIWEENFGGGQPDDSSAGSPLTNGIDIALWDGPSKVLDFTDGLPVKTNADWFQLAGIDAPTESAGGGQQARPVRWSFNRFGEPLELRGQEWFGFHLRDNFKRRCTVLRFMVQGDVI